jgi:hypothetical protein
MCSFRGRDKRGGAVVNAVMKLVYVLSFLWADLPYKEYFLHLRVVRFRVYFWVNKGQTE